jgi:archaellin
VVDGPVYGYSTAPGPTGNITSLIFWLKTASAASSVDLNVNKTTIGFQNSRGVWPNIYNSGGDQLSYTVGTTTYTVGSGGATTIVWEVGTGFQLMPGQKVRVTIDLTKLQTGSTTAGQIMKNEEFKIVIKPPVGSVLEIDRIAPAAVDTVNDLG